MASPVLNLFDRLWFCNNVLASSARLPFLSPDTSPVKQFEQLQCCSSYTGQSADDAYCNDRDERGGEEGEEGEAEGRNIVDAGSCTENHEYSRDELGEERTTLCLYGTQPLVSMKQVLGDEFQRPTALFGHAQQQASAFLRQQKSRQPSVTLGRRWRPCDRDDADGDDQDPGCRCRIPYGSYHLEAWLLLSALSNLKVSGKNEHEDMKEHLRLWAQAVASTVRQEC